MGGGRWEGRQTYVTTWMWEFMTLLGRGILPTEPLPGSCRIKSKLLQMVNIRPLLHWAPDLVLSARTVNFTQ